MGCRAKLIAFVMMSSGRVRLKVSYSFCLGTRSYADFRSTNASVASVSLLEMWRAIAASVPVTVWNPS